MSVVLVSSATARRKLPLCNLLRTTSGKSLMRYSNWNRTSLAISAFSLTASVVFCAKANAAATRFYCTCDDLDSTSDRLEAYMADDGLVWIALDEYKVNALLSTRTAWISDASWSLRLRFCALPCWRCCCYYCLLCFSSSWLLLS